MSGCLWGNWHKFDEKTKELEGLVEALDKSNSAAAHTFVKNSERIESLERVAERMAVSLKELKWLLSGKDEDIRFETKTIPADVCALGVFERADASLSEYNQLKGEK